MANESEVTNSVKLPIFARASTTEKIIAAVESGVLKYPCYVYDASTGFYGFVEKDKTLSWFKGNNKELVVMGSELPDSGDEDVLYIIDNVPYVYSDGSWTSLLGEVENKISVLQENVGALNDLTATMDETLSSVQDNVSALQTGQAGLEARATQLETDVGTLQDSVSGLTSSVEGLGTRLTGAEGDIDALETSVSTISSSVTTLETNVSNLTTRVEDLETHIGDITEIETAVNTLEESVSSIETALDGKANANEVYTSSQIDTMIGDLGGRSVEDYVADQIQLNIV